MFQIIGSITSRCSGKEPALSRNLDGLEKTAEIEPIQISKGSQVKNPTGSPTWPDKLIENS